MTVVDNARLFAATLTANGALQAGRHNPVDATGGARTVALPLTVTTGAALSVEKRDGSVNAVIVSGSIRGTLTTISLLGQYETLTFRYDGATWVPTEGRTVRAVGATAARPSASTAGVGAQFYDSTLSKPIWSDGSVWRDAAGTAV